MPVTRPQKAKAPSYRHHKPSGQAFVQLKGKRYYLGKHGSDASQEAYSRFLAENVHGRRVPLPPAPPAAVLSIITLIDRYWIHAQEHYVKHGEPTGSAKNQRPALKRLLELYGTMLASEFGPKKLKALRDTWIADGNSQATVRDKTSTIRVVFAWGVSEELVPAAVHHALETVNETNSRRGRKRPPVLAVPDDIIDATLPHLPPIVADMVRFQRLSGCRPQEVRLLRFREVQRFDRPDRDCPLWESKDQPPQRELSEWIFRPGRHKTEHHGQTREMAIGPKLQEILRPHLARLAFKPDQFVFTTAGGKPYSKDEYIRAIRRACEAAFNMPLELRDGALSTAAQLVKQDKLTPEQLQLLRQEAARWRADHVWSPNKLRHTAATEIRRKAGTAEAAQVVLGHKKLSTTEIYAERNLDQARSIMREIG